MPKKIEKKKNDKKTDHAKSALVKNNCQKTEKKPRKTKNTHTRDT